MLFQLNQVQTNLRRIEEIPNTFFQNIQLQEQFGDELFPPWFREYYGNRTDGLFQRARDLYNEIKNSGREDDIVDGYISSIQIESKCLNIDSILFYCESVSDELFVAAKEYFHYLYKSLDYEWVNKLSETSVNDYIREFKTLNRINICPVCGNEKIKSSKYEARAALDHWLCKAKYPFSSVSWDNLFPLGEGCNRPPVKGEKEIIWIDNDRSIRQTFFYPFNWLGEIQISLECIEEPSIENLTNGSWKFNFIGNDANHQDLINKWDVFFGINDRWIDETLNEFIETWTYTFAVYLIEEISYEDFEVKYDEKLNSFCNVRNSFNVNPQNRVEWFFLSFLINEATSDLYNAYKEMVRDHIKNII